MYFARQLGRYHLLDRIAIGGMAEIYRAKTFDSTGKEHLVAIKRVIPKLAEDDDLLQMLVDEAKLVSQLSHPNIASVYEFARVGDDYFIAMEYIDGRDLRTILNKCLKNRISIPIEHSAFIILSVLEALHAAHTHKDATGECLNIVHRDISPANLLIAFEGQIKLCDFGIAKAKHSRMQTQTGVIKGKVKYMSPEQAMGKVLDCRSDIFSCGSVLYELVTGEQPFIADDETSLLFLVRDTRYRRPKSLNPNLPDPLEAIIKKLMSRSRRLRYQSAEEAANALRLFLEQFFPDYTPSSLGLFIQSLFTTQIEKDRKKLGEYVIENPDPKQKSFNLLAEVLGEGATYTQFTALPNQKALETHLTNADTKIIPRLPPPEKRLPKCVDLHQMKTEIIDREERDQRILKRKRRRRPGSSFYESQKDPSEAKTSAIKMSDTKAETSNSSALNAHSTEVSADFHPQPTETDREVASLSPTEKSYEIESENFAEKYDEDESSMDFELEELEQTQKS